METITIDEFKKLDIRIGEIKSVQKIENTDKLLKLEVSFGDEVRQVVSGIANFFPDVSTLVGKKCAFAYNLESKTIRGYESQGMILATSTDEQLFLLESSAMPGSKIK